MSLMTRDPVAKNLEDPAAIDAVEASYGSPSAADATEIVQPRPFDPLAALSQNTSPQEATSGPDAPPSANDLLRKLDAILTEPPGPVWKPAPIVNANKPVNGAQNYKAIQGDAKYAAAEEMEMKIKIQLAETLDQLAATGRISGDPAATSTSAEKPGIVSAAAGGLARDSVIGALAMTVGGPPAVVVATAMAAARTGLGGLPGGLEGKGTMATFDKPGEWVFTAANGKKRHGKGSEISSFTGYGENNGPSLTSSSPSIAQPAGQTPVSGAFQQKMNRGPGFGRGDILARSTLTGQGLDGIERIEIPEDSPVAKTIQGMKDNAEGVQNVMRRQKIRGVDATIDNALLARDFGMEKQLEKTEGPKIPTFVM